MLVDHGGGSRMAPVLRRRWTPGAWKGGRRRDSAVELRRRRACERRRRTSVGRETKRRWRPSEPRWGQAVLTIKHRRWREAEGGARRRSLLTGVLRGDGMIEHLRSGSSSNWSKRWWRWSSGWHNILRRWSRVGLLGCLLVAGPLVLIGGVHGWGGTVLLAAVALDGRKIVYRGRNTEGWRQPLHGRGSLHGWEPLHGRGHGYGQRPHGCILPRQLVGGWGEAGGRRSVGRTSVAAVEGRRRHVVLHVVGVGVGRGGALGQDRDGRRVGGIVVIGGRSLAAVLLAPALLHL